MININLIAERRERRIREMMIIRVGTLSVICLIVLMVLLNSAAWLLKLSAQSDLIGINKQLSNQQPRYEQWQQVQAEIAARQPVVALLEQVQKSEGAWMTILGDLSQITPSEVVLDGLGTAASDKVVQLRLTGRARDENTLAAFMLAISKDTRWAGEPELKSLSGENKTDTKGLITQRPLVHFELLVPVRGLVGGDL